MASVQALEAIKILSGNPQAVSPHLTLFELWENRVRQINVAHLPSQASCPACQGREFPWLEGRMTGQTAVLCGRNAVQVSPAAPTELSLDALAQNLAGLGQLRQNRYLVRLAVDGYLLTIFADGRAIIGGTDDIATARTLYARYVGA